MNKENVRKLEPFYEEIWRNSKRFTNTNEDAPSYIDVDKVFELVDKYDAINENKLEQRDNIINKAREKIKKSEYAIDFETNGFSLTDYDINELLEILNIDKGDE